MAIQAGNVSIIEISKPLAFITGTHFATYTGSKVTLGHMSLEATTPYLLISELTPIALDANAIVSDSTDFIYCLLSDEINSDISLDSEMSIGCSLDAAFGDMSIIDIAALWAKLDSISLDASASSQGNYLTASFSDFVVDSSTGSQLDYALDGLVLDSETTIIGAEISCQVEVTLDNVTLNAIQKYSGANKSLTYMNRIIDYRLYATITGHTGG